MQPGLYVNTRANTPLHIDPDSPFQDISVSIRQSTPRPEVGRHALHTLRFLARSPTPERAPTPDPVAPPALITSPVRAPSPAANRAPVSPLPPSSPPSVSSDDQNPQPGSLPRPEFVEYEVQVDHHSSDDPFGFFAAERKIKAKRELTRPASHITLSDPPSPAPLPEPEQANQIDSDEELYTDRPAAPSPPPRALSHASTITPASSPPRHGPSTPPARARRVKRGRPVSLAQSEASSHTASVSPSKSVIAATKVAHDTPVAKRLRRTKGKENWDAGDSDPPTPPIALLGPARRAARAAAGSQALPAKGKGKAKAVIDDEESEDEPRAKRRKPVSRGTKRAAAKPRSRGVRTKKPVEKEVETDEDEEEVSGVLSLRLNIG